jgi:hypothetical protein
MSGVIDLLCGKSPFGLKRLRKWRSGAVGTAFVWFGLLLDLIPLALVGYCCYLCFLLSDGDWLSISGAAALVCAILFIIVCSSATVLQVMCQFGRVGDNKVLFHVLRIAAFVVAFILLSVLITFFSPAAAERSRGDFHEIIPSDPQAASCAGLPTHEAQKWIWRRTLAPRLPLLSLWIIWLAVFSLHLLAFNVIDNELNPKAAGLVANVDQLDVSVPRPARASGRERKKEKRAGRPSNFGFAS